MSSEQSRQSRTSRSGTSKSLVDLNIPLCAVPRACPWLVIEQASVGTVLRIPRDRRDGGHLVADERL